MVKHEIADRIVLMSSVCGLQSHANTSAYGATKAAIRHLAISLADELGPYGITVNAVAPGATMNERAMSDSAYVDGWQAVAPTGTVGTVEDVAYTTLFVRRPGIPPFRASYRGGWWLDNHESIAELPGSRAPYRKATCLFRLTEDKPTEFRSVRWKTFTLKGADVSLQYTQR